MVSLRRVIASLLFLLILDLSFFALMPYRVLFPWEFSYDPPPADVVAILFHDFNAKNNGMDEETRRRVNHGLDLFRQGKARAMIVAGGNRPCFSHKGSLFMAAYLEKCGVPKEKVFIENHSWDTLSNVTGIWSIMTDLQWRTLILVSAPDHLERIRLIAPEEVREGVTLSPYLPLACDPPLTRKEIFIAAHKNLAALLAHLVLPGSWYDSLVAWVRTYTAF